MNDTTKNYIRNNRVYNYELARHLGISESTFNRMMREELDIEHKNLVIRAVDELVMHKAIQNNKR